MKMTIKRGGFGIFYSGDPDKSDPHNLTKVGTVMAFGRYFKLARFKDFGARARWSLRLGCIYRRFPDHERLVFGAAPQ